MVVSGLLYAAGAAAVRYLGDRYPTVELVFIRTTIGLCLLVGPVLRLGPSILKTRRPTGHALRSLFGFVGMTASFYSYVQMPLVEAYALQFTLPLFTILLASLILEERAEWQAWVACAVGFAGVLIILRPGMIAVSLGALAAISAAFCFAGSNISIRILSRNDPIITITFYANLFMMIFAAVPTAIYWTTPSWSDAPWLLAIGILSTGGQIALGHAIAAAHARVIQPFDFLRLPFAAAFGFALFSEFPDLWTCVGAIVIFIAASWVARREAVSGRG